MIFIIFRYRYSAFRAVHSQIVFYIFNTRNAQERLREREKGRRGRERERWAGKNEREQRRAERIYR